MIESLQIWVPKLLYIGAKPELRCPNRLRAEHTIFPTNSVQNKSLSAPKAWMLQEIKAFNEMSRAGMVEYDGDLDK